MSATATAARLRATRPESPSPSRVLQVKTDLPADERLVILSAREQEQAVNYSRQWAVGILSLIQIAPWVLHFFKVDNQ